MPADRIISEAFHIMTKPNGPICNLDCTYCFYLEKENLYPGNNNWRMSDEVLESYIRQYIEIQKAHEVTFTWQGGEPTLLGVEFFKHAVELQKKYAHGKKINNALQTNGVLLTDEWCEFLAENNFLIGISIDGPEEINDQCRYYKGGQPSFHKVMNGLKLLIKHKIEFNTLTCVTRYNAKNPIEVYDFLKEIGSRFMQFIPIVERRAVEQNEKLKLVSQEYEFKSEVTEWSVEPLQFGKFLSSIFDEWIRKDVGKYFVQVFDVALESWAGVEQNLCVFQKKCGRALALEHNGDLYSCDHYVYPQYKLGNIAKQNLGNLVDSSAQNNFGSNKNDSLPQYCINCSARFACNGECPKHRFIKTPDGDDGLNYLCEGYKFFFNHIDVYMKFMTNQLQSKHPPANVMKWVKEKDQGFPDLKPLRNQLCPCGSGKKYKYCCANIDGSKN